MHKNDWLRGQAARLLEVLLTLLILVYPIGYKKEKKKQVKIFHHLLLLPLLPTFKHLTIFSLQIELPIFPREVIG